MHANAALCRVRSLAGQGGEMQSITYMEYTLHVHTRIKEESYIVRSHRGESSTGHELDCSLFRIIIDSSRHDQVSSCKSVFRDVRMSSIGSTVPWRKKKSRDDQQASPAAQ